MNSYFSVIITSISFLTVLDLLISKSKNGRVAKTVISVVSVTMLAYPVVSLIKNFNLSYTPEADVNFEIHLLENKKSFYENSIKNSLNELGFEILNVNCEFDSKKSYNLNKITVKTKFDVINKNDANIYMVDEIKKLLKSVTDVNFVEIIIEKTT